MSASASVPVPVNPALTPGLTPPAPGRTGGAARPGAPEGPAFAEVLRKAGAGAGPGAASGSDASAPLRFSRHALERVQRRGIELGPATLARLSEGVGRAAGKGSRDSLVLIDGTAFVVAVPNRTVVTAVGAEHMREQVFTNIDSAVIA